MSATRACLRVVIVVSLIVAAVATMGAQADGQIVGMVRDAQRSVLPGVTVEVSSPDLPGKTRSTTTDANGQYRISNLPRGTYTVTFTLVGFTTQKREGVALVSGFTAPVSATMIPGGGQIAGSARDASGVLLAGVYVEITSRVLVETLRSVNTGSDGRFRFIDLPDGTYSVTFTFPGFWTLRRENVVLSNGSSAAVDVTMRVGGNNPEPIVAVQSPIRWPV